MNEAVQSPASSTAIGRVVMPPAFWRIPRAGSRPWPSNRAGYLPFPIAPALPAQGTGKPSCLRAGEPAGNEPVWIKMRSTSSRLTCRGAGFALPFGHLGLLTKVLYLTDWLAHEVNTSSAATCAAKTVLLAPKVYDFS